MISLSNWNQGPNSGRFLQAFQACSNRDALQSDPSWATEQEHQDTHRDQCRELAVSRGPLKSHLQLRIRVAPRIPETPALTSNDDRARFRTRIMLITLEVSRRNLISAENNEGQRAVPYELGCHTMSKVLYLTV